MEAELRELYQQVILDHNRKPRNFGALENADRDAEGYNPLCGDRIRVHLALDDDNRISGVAFTGEGCAICTASASLMTEGVKDKTPEEVQGLFDQFHDLVTGDLDTSPDTEHLGKLAVFAGIREYPIRIKCATLPWHTLQAAMKNDPDSVSTES